MNILITDWGDLEQALPIALQYQVGLELLEFAVPEYLDNWPSISEKTLLMIRSVSLLGFHGPYSELVPATRDPLVRQITRTRFQQGYDMAQMLGADHLILHSGYIPKTYPRDVWLQSSLKFWLDFLVDKPSVNMVHMENVYEDDFTILCELADEVNQLFHEERLTICLDIGHVNTNSTKTLAEWITALGDRIRYTHLHNNDGILDDHWRLDKGNIRVEETLNLLAKHAPRALWTIETNPDDIEPSLLWLRERGFL